VRLEVLENLVIIYTTELPCKKDKQREKKELIYLPLMHITAREEYKFGENAFENYMCRSPLVLSPFSGSGTPGIVSSCLVCHISM
jgi:hypothetical protein